MANQVNILSLNINNDQLVKKLSETKRQLDELQKSQKELIAAGQSSSEQYVKQAAQIQNLNTAYNSQKNVLAQLNAAKQKANNVADALNQALHQEVETIAQATANNRQLIAIRNNLSTTTKEGADAIALINQKLDENNKLTKENVSVAEKQKMTIGGYKDQITEALSALNPFNGGISGFSERAREAGGAGTLLRNSFSQLTTGIGGATKAALTFIATPIGAIIAGVVAAFAAGKAIFDFNMGLQQSNKELKALGVNASEISKVRSEIQATADTFDKDFKDIASKANSLAKAYGISMSEANNIIAQGLASGGAQNEEFLDSLGEYDQMFKNAGFSAQEFVNVINTGYDLGVYADKLPDAIKEAGLALNEQTKSTRDALVNAFGATFSDDILKKVRTGEMTTKEALQAIAKESEKTQLTQQQQAQLTADVFKGAGEDAGGAIMILQAVGQASQKELDATAKKQLELQESTERLNKAQAELFEVEGFGDIWTAIKVAATDGLSAILEYLADVKKDIQPIIDLVAVVLANAWTSLKTTVGVVFDFISGNFKIVANTISTFFNFFKKIISGDFSGAMDALKNGFQNLLNIVDNTFGRIKNTIINGIKSLIENISPALELIGVDVAKLQQRLDGLKSKEVELKSKTSNESTSTSNDKKVVADVDPNAAAKAKAATDAAAKARDEEQKALDALILKQRQQIDLFIAEQGFRKKSVQDQLKLDEQVMNQRLALNDVEFKAGKISKEAYETTKLNLTSDYAKRQAEAMVANAQDELEVYKLGLASRKEVEGFYTQERLNSKVAENNELLAKEVEFERLRFESGLINQQDFNAAVNALNEENRLVNEEAQAQRDEAEKERKLIDLENQQLLDEEKFVNDFELQLARQEIKYQAERQAASLNGANLTLIEEKNALAKKKITDAYDQQRLSSFKSMFGEMAQLLGENTAAGKAAGIASATINTYEGITQVWAAKSTLPEPFATGAKIASTATVLASGLGAVKKIMSTKVPKFRDGGLAVGNSHEQGGIPFSINGSGGYEMEGGEAIINKRSTAKHRNLLSAINVDGGGRAFGKGGALPYRFANGGVAGNFSLGNLNGMKLDIDSLASKIGQEVAMANQTLPAPQVEVVDITSAQRARAKIVAKASF